jgi:hypothetical protein
MDFAREFDLAAQVIEKDYVLGWVLAGILNRPRNPNSKKDYKGDYPRLRPNAFSNDERLTFGHLGLRARKLIP